MTTVASFLQGRAAQLSAGAMAVLLVMTGMGVAAVSYAAADRLVHPPRELSDLTPAARGVAFERVEFPSEDGVPLRGWWMPAAHATGTVVFLHGYGASKAQSLAVAPFLVHGGFNVLAFDFRAHGESGGRYTSIGIEEARDVRGAVAYLHARADVDGARIALFGWSMGAAAAIHAADDLPEVRALIADSGFASLANVVANNLGAFTGLPPFPFAPMIVHFASRMAGHDPGENEPAREAPELRRPLLVIQGADDPIARPDGDGSRLAQAGGTRAQYWLVGGAGHVDARRASPEEYEARVLSFLRASLL